MKHDESIDRAAPTKEEAIAVLQQERDERVRACNAELQAVLEKYQCRLHAEPQYQNGLTVAVIHLLPI